VPEERTGQRANARERRISPANVAIAVERRAEEEVRVGILGTRASVSTLGDSDLLERSRSGDKEAYAELWRRHSRAGITVARSYTSSFDPDDVVAESYAKIFQTLQSGGGPTGAFRPYLFTTIRNTAAAWGRARRETAIDDAEQIEDPAFSEENTLAALDRSLTATAFQSLPTRWQEALWYSEVEAMTPQEIAPLLGMKANAVAALTYRAREGLRQAWIQAHISSVPADSECRWTIERLGSYARKGLGRRETSRIDSHLATCARCGIVAAEAKDVGSRLTLVLLPLAAGLAGATGYTAWLQAGSHAAVYALGAGGVVMPAAAVGTPVGAGGGASAGGAGAAAGGAGAGGTAAAGATAGAAVGAAAGVSGVVVGSVITGVLVAAGVAAAIVVGPTLFGGAPKTQQADAPSVSSKAPSDPSASTPASPTATAAPTASPSPSALPESLPGAGDDSTAPAARTEPVSPPDVIPTPPPPPAPPVAPDAPVVDSVLADPAGLVAASGSGAPGNTVTGVVSAVPASAARGFSRAAVPPPTVTMSTTVDASGRWSLSHDLSALPNGTYTLTLTQTGPTGLVGTASASSFSLAVAPSTPSILSPAPDAVFTGTDLTVSGQTSVDGATPAADALAVSIGGTEKNATIGADGAWSVSMPVFSLTSGGYPITATPSYRGHAGTPVVLRVTIALPAPVISAPADGATPVTVPSIEVAGTGRAGATVTVTVPGIEKPAVTTTDSDGAWAATLDLGALANGDYTVSATENNGGTVESAPAERGFALRVPPATPTITSVDTGGDGRYLPIVAGTGIPGASVTITGGSAPVTVTVGDDGRWISPVIQGFRAGANSISVTQSIGGVSSLEPAESSFDLIAPSVRLQSTGGPVSDGFVFIARGVPGATVSMLADFGPWLDGISLDADGSYDSAIYTWLGHNSADTISIRYQSKDGSRIGLQIDVPFSAPGAAAQLARPGAPVTPEQNSVPQIGQQTTP
jgi:RNA polymerase sigma factor (sigma-70 family)